MGRLSKNKPEEDSRMRENSLPKNMSKLRFIANKVTYDLYASQHNVLLFLHTAAYVPSIV